ncbi:hypothetical protein CCR75_004761 [Bremia lactucae]|uniref:Secreted RxLR effector n=1 Tax=Bremia lactucae TaxID=4779 RepID=A0A976FKG2_BRELC|nr:hypothetical protein CCR75_004761 [Bremia lactucae]
MVRLYLAVLATFLAQGNSPLTLAAFQQVPADAELLAPEQEGGSLSRRLRVHDETSADESERGGVSSLLAKLNASSKPKLEDILASAKLEDLEKQIVKYNKYLPKDKQLSLYKLLREHQSIPNIATALYAAKVHIGDELPPLIARLWEDFRNEWKGIDGGIQKLANELDMVADGKEAILNGKVAVLRDYIASFSKENEVDTILREQLTIVFGGEKNLVSILAKLYSSALGNRSAFLEIKPALPIIESIQLSVFDKWLKEGLSLNQVWSLIVSGRNKGQDLSIGEYSVFKAYANAFLDRQMTLKSDKFVLYSVNDISAAPEATFLDYYDLVLDMSLSDGERLFFLLDRVGASSFVFEPDFYRKLQGFDKIGDLPGLITEAIAAKEKTFKLLNTNGEAIKTAKKRGTFDVVTPEAKKIKHLQNKWKQDMSFLLKAKHVASSAKARSSGLKY